MPQRHDISNGSSGERITLSMMTGEEPTRPWVLDLGTAQRGMAPNTSRQRYDDSEQITFSEELNIAAIDVSGNATITNNHIYIDHSSEPHDHDFPLFSPTPKCPLG